METKWKPTTEIKRRIPFPYFLSEKYGRNPMECRRTKGAGNQDGGKEEKRMEGRVQTSGENRKEGKERRKQERKGEE